MRPFPQDQSLGPWYRLAAVLLWPPMMTITRREWTGVENLGLPGDGMVIAANHMSWFDPMVIAHFMNDNDRVPRFLGKDTVFQIPVAGRIISGAGQIPVYRETDDAGGAVRAAVAAVNAGEAVVVYPEGTLTRDPDLWPMTGKTGAARISLLSGKPVVPMAHWGAQQVMRPYEKEFNALPPKLIRVAAGPPVDLDDLRGREMTSDVLVEATSRIVDAITDLLATLRKESSPGTRWNPKSGKREPVRHPVPLTPKEAAAMATAKKATTRTTTAKKAASAAKKAPAKKAAPAAKKAQAKKVASSVKKAQAKKVASAAKKASTKKATVKKTVAKRTAAVKKTVAKRTTAVKKAPAKKAAVKKTVAKRTAAVEKAVAKRTAAVKKTVAKRTAAVEKTVAKRTAAVEKTVAKRSAAVKKVAKKAPVKKAPVKKAPVKKAPVKKAPVKKAPVKKAPAKKAPAKKATVKRTAKRA